MESRLREYVLVEEDSEEDILGVSVLGWCERCC